MAAKKNTEIELDQFLPYRLSVLTNRVSRALAAYYADTFELTIPEWRVMAVLGRYPGISAAEVADKTAMDKVAVSRAVARLEKSGRVLRTTDATDQRRAVLRFSAVGNSVYRKIAPAALAYESALLEALSGQESKSLDAILDKLTDKAVSLAEQGLNAAPSDRQKKRRTRQR